MTAMEERQPIIVADSGPLIRLAAAGLLDTLRGLNRRIVLVDRVRAEVTGDLTKPYAGEITAWVASMGDAIQHVETVTGVGIETLRKSDRTPAQDRLLKQAMRDSGELALREFVGHWRPTEASSALIVYEDQRVASLFIEADFPVTIVTTRKFADLISKWGVNVNAREALEAVAPLYDLKPALIAQIDPEVPVDLRRLPQPENLP
ncbi:MAG: hypothetical protein ACRERV_15435 [Methylococcales bacterium]